jgi:hypothetical protein
MAPGGVRADEHDEVGLVEVGIHARHGIGAEGAAVAGNRGRHAQARVGVDVGRADEALHQLVGHVIILGEELAREIEGDRVRPVLRDDVPQTSRDAVESAVPTDAGKRAVSLPQHRMQQSSFGAKRLAERRSL